MESLSTSIRNAILSSSMSRYELSKLTGVEQAALSRFVNRKVGLTLDSADKLAAVLGLRLVVDTKAKGRKAR